VAGRIRPIQIIHLIGTRTRDLSACTIVPQRTTLPCAPETNTYTFFKYSNSQIGTNVRVRVFNAGLLTRSQFVSERSCDRPNPSRFSVVSIGPRGNAELVPKFHVALLASHAALPVVTSKFRSNVALPILD
jgi:hypothetical protein